MNSLSDFLEKSAPAVARAGLSAYSNPNELQSILRSLGEQLGWGDAGGMFSKVIPANARVLVKPNLVLHQNMGPWSFDAVTTHPALVQETVMEVLRTGISEVHIGDAPIQSCDFDRLLRRTGLGSWSRDLAAREKRFSGIQDFRRTIASFERGIRVAQEDKIDLAEYVLFDLGRESLLEPVTTNESLFRVTCYDPKFLAKTHSPGRHQYLITKDVLAADVVINLPKLKMHKKAGITNALKNLVGINGNKEYLPHHRIGGGGSKGDCYPGKSLIKEAIERIYDFQNASPDGSRARLAAPLLRPLLGWLSIAGDETGIEGSWSGNDTVWRMSLDLNRILVYGKVDGTMSVEPQRRVLHICDGIVAGQGNGPLAPEPLNLNVLLAGDNPAALDFVGAYMLGLDPFKVPIVQGAFGQFSWPLTHFSSDDVVVTLGGQTQSLEGIIKSLGSEVPQRFPAGWTSVVREDVMGAAFK
ncbi:MAG TPA: DUF362 domain-containing protein [Candidatus Angelobacter sp.]|nr:DUF362 domain-containing protein [Candidatus Angelobacter sp.]